MCQFQRGHALRNVSVAGLLLLLGACGLTPPKSRPTPAVSATARTGTGAEVALYALSLLDRDYRFGGANPESGLDCSGMVRHIYGQSAGIWLPHNAAKQARLGREVPLAQLAPGDLVFFNTTGKSFSHVGVYLGDHRFIHAPRTNGKIKVSSLSNRYFSSRFEAARRYAP